MGQSTGAWQRSGQPRAMFRVPSYFYTLVLSGFMASACTEADALARRKSFAYT